MQTTVTDGGITTLKNGLTSKYNDRRIPVRDSISLLYASVAWVNMPLVNQRYQFTNPMDIPCDVTVDINIEFQKSKIITFNQICTFPCQRMRSIVDRS